MGQVMPTLTMDCPRLLPGLDALLGMRKHTTAVAWKLISYSDQA
jgi:uncharacterized protein